MTDDRTIDYTDARPESIEPITFNLGGYYQADPYKDHEEDRPDGWDWHEAQWHETFRFVAIAPWNEVNRVIRGVAQDPDGNLIVAAGIDLSRFLVENCLDDDNKHRLAALLSDRYRVLSQRTLGKVVFDLIGRWGGRPTTR